MKLQPRLLNMMLSLGLMLILAGAVLVPTARASMEDAAIFYDELKDHGEWVDYGDYGPVWYPTGVQENWRPYVDGRWTPSEEGYVFETQEPWGFATYHYGNWMPTPEYGWVWVPGRTWYPNTVTWRTSPESEAPDASYIGWAPIPPPNYTPAPGYYPEGYYGGGYYRGGLESLITAPFWIFVKAASFLLGFSSPYSPAYSYWSCNCLIPPPALPYYITRTVIVNNYYTPAYYPAGYLIAGRGYYNWGPPIPYVARVTRINQVTINNYMRQVNIYERRNVVPPPAVLARRPYLREVVPPPLLAHQPLPRGARAHDLQAARANLVRPNLLNAHVIKEAPKFSATIPKVRPAGMASGSWQRGVPGAALPAGAMIKPDRRMEEHLRRIPPHQRLEPVSPSARKWSVPPMPGMAATPTGPPPQVRGPEITSTSPAAPLGSPPKAAPFRPGSQGAAQTGAPSPTGPAPHSLGRHGRPSPGEGIVPGGPGTGPTQAGAPQERYKPRERQSGPWGRHEQTRQTSPAPAPVFAPKQMQTSTTPGTPPAAAPTGPTPGQVQPRRRPWTPPGQQQSQTPFQPKPQIMPVRQPQPPPPQIQRAPQPPPQPAHRQPEPRPQLLRPLPQVQPQPRPQPQAQAHPRPSAPQKPQGKKPDQQ